MPRKIRELVTDLQNAGFVLIPGAGKGSHRKFVHSLYPGAVTLSGKDGSDAKHYQVSKFNVRLTRLTMKTIDTYHRWVEWSDDDQTYIGRCPDLITGIHGDDPVQVYKELAEVVQEVIDHYQLEGKLLPPPRTRPMMEVL